MTSALETTRGIPTPQPLRLGLDQPGEHPVPALEGGDLPRRHHRPDLTTDYAGTKNVAADHRDKVIEMIGRWWAEAGKHNVLPIDGSMLERLRVERPTIAKRQTTARMSSPSPAR